MQALAEESLAFFSKAIESLPDEMVYQSPVEFTEEHRYIPKEVSPQFPGYIRYDLVPYFIEILECFDVRSDVREVAIKKAVQIAYTTVLESIIFYLAACVRSAPGMYVTADLGLSAARITNNILPMFLHSGLGDIFQSADLGNSRKQGVTKAMLQWVGGGSLLPYGAQSAAKARQATILFMLMDELDGWPIEFSRDGDPIRLFKDRCSGVWPIRKILMGSTPLLEGSSHIDRQYLRGDQRQYKCRCLKCGFPQRLRWAPPPAYEGPPWGMLWDYSESGALDHDSVRYACENCQYGHQEHDKARFINKDNSYWEPTAMPVEPNVRSYHIPGMLSRMQPWYKCVAAWLEAWDPKTRRITNPSALKVFYNNILGKSFRVVGDRVSFQMASSHRRTFYKKGEIPNAHVMECCGSEIVFLTCTVDAHHDNLAVAIWGWTAGFRCWLIDYFRLYDDSPEGCESLSSPVWFRLSELIESGLWTDDRQVAYNIKLTLIDSAWAAATVTEYCAGYAQSVFPIRGERGILRSTGIREFSEFTTKLGTAGYLIYVDHYKDRISPALRRGWQPAGGEIQNAYTFNAPVDTTDDELRELMVEYKRKQTNPNGMSSWVWYRPSGARNELWDLMVYGHASVELLAWNICMKAFGLDAIDWEQFWEYARESLGTRGKGG